MGNRRASVLGREPHETEWRHFDDIGRSSRASASERKAAMCIHPEEPADHDVRSTLGRRESDDGTLDASEPTSLHDLV
jgi:hypothetical protein